MKTTELIARGAPIADVGVSPAVDAAAFALPAGRRQRPDRHRNGAVVVKVLEQPELTAAELAGGKDAVRSDLLGRAAQPVLQRLHGQGARADADQRQPADDRADPRVGSAPTRCIS